MSLLMQALKKAEHAKQKQTGAAADDKGNGTAPDDALSLSPKEAAGGIAAAPDTAIGTPAASEHVDRDAPNSALTLSPQSEEKTGDFVAAEADPGARPIAARAHGAESQEPPPRSASMVEEAAAVRTANALKESADPPEAASRNLTRANMPKISAEQKQAEVKAEQAILAEQQKARAVFSSKSPARKRRNVWIAIVGLTILLVQAGIGYFYWQNTNLATNTVALGVPPPLESPTAPSGAALIPSEPVVPAPATAAVPAQAASAAPATKPLPVVSNSAVTTAPAAPEEKNAVEQTAANLAAATPSSKPEATTPNLRKAARAQPAIQAPDGSAIQIRQSSSGDQINPALTSAYQFFISGDAAAARQQYQKVLQQEPGNRDALLGMAAIALNQRQAEQAGAFYARLLELDPADPEAIAGLTSLQQGDPVQSESRLKKILSQNPQAGAVLFALGNLYAQQSRWPDAQQTYFRAYTSAPANADYAFNLAVSLDRLNQPRLAHEYYRRALALGQSGPGNFSRGGVEKRIRELEAPAD